MQAQDKDGNLIFTEVPALDGNGNTVYTDKFYTTPSGVVLMKKEPVMITTRYDYHRYYAAALGAFDTGFT